MKTILLIGVIIFNPGEHYWFTKEFKDYGYLNMTACQAHKRKMQKTVIKPMQLFCR